MQKVNSYDEWSPLKEVIVGSARGYLAHGVDLSFRLFFHDVAFSSFYYPSVEREEPTRGHGSIAIEGQYVEELEEDVEGFVRALEGLGVLVHRPAQLERLEAFTTPSWQTVTTPALNIRDQTLILGDVILETSPQVRARYFENDQLRDIFYGYMEKGSGWLCMPRPVLKDQSFDTSYVRDRPIPTIERVSADGGGAETQYEIMLDGAQCLRFGRDILVNVANANHLLAFRWLERAFGAGFRFHRLDRLADNHIDTKVLPLRPGLLLARDREVLSFLPRGLQNWDLVVAPRPKRNMFPSYGADDLMLTSEFIDLNVLSIDENTVVVNSLFPELVALLEGRGFTVVEVLHRHRRLFGGGFHCFTLDTVREGSGPETYFQ